MKKNIEIHHAMCCFMTHANDASLKHVRISTMKRIQKQYKKRIKQGNKRERERNESTMWICILPIIIVQPDADHERPKKKKNTIIDSGFLFFFSLLNN
jgi:hypothetical protein